MNPIKTYNSFSILDDNELLEKLADTLNNTEKTIKITASYDEALLTAKQYEVEGYTTNINNYGGNYHVNIKPRTQLELQSALESGQFKKLAFGKYSFSKQANNPLGIKPYNFDEGTIWQVMKGKDGKEYLVKEIDDNNSDKVIRSKSKSEKSTILASSKTDKKQLTRLAKILYNNPSDEFINDLMRVSSDLLSTTVTAKLNNVINSELDALNITSPQFRNHVREKIAMAISTNTLFNRDQLSKIIKDFNKIDLNSLSNIK